MEAYSRPEKLAVLDKLVVAVEKGDVTAVRDLLQRGLVDVAETDGYIANGFTALGWAAAKGWKDLAQLLIAAGAPVDTADKWGLTPLMRAAIGGKSASAKVLLDKGASLDKKSLVGKTARDYAAEKQHGLIEELLQNEVEARRLTAAEALNATLHATAADKQDRLRAHAPRLVIKPA